MSDARQYSQEDLLKHRTKESCWLSIGGKVYDVTTFLDKHPGGADLLLKATGRDATPDFDEVGHSADAKKQLAQYLIGTYTGPRLTKKPADGGCIVA